MALARKGTKKIVVEGVEYRWTLSPDDEPGVAIIVEHATIPGWRLVSWVDHGIMIGPGLVQQAILEGLKVGWLPEGRGPDLVQRIPAFSQAIGTAKLETQI